MNKGKKTSHQLCPWMDYFYTWTGDLRIVDLCHKIAILHSNTHQQAQLQKGTLVHFLTGNVSCWLEILCTYKVKCFTHWLFDLQLENVVHISPAVLPSVGCSVQQSVGEQLFIHMYFFYLHGCEIAACCMNKTWLLVVLSCQKDASSWFTSELGKFYFVSK